MSDDFTVLHEAISEFSIPNKWIVTVDTLLRDLFTRTLTRQEPEIIFHKVKKQERRLLHKMCNYYGLSHESYGGEYKSASIGVGNCELEFDEHTGGIERVYSNYEEIKFYKWKNVHVSRSSLECPAQVIVTDILLQARTSDKAIQTARHYIKAIHKRYEERNYSMTNFRFYEIEKLPSDCLTSIMSFLPALDLASMGLCCRAWYILSSDDLLWGKFFKKKSGVGIKKQLMNLNYEKYDGPNMRCGCKYAIIMPLHSHCGEEIEPQDELPIPLYEMFKRKS
jgi:hypothetical protein